ncbi:MAG: methyltransferase domain-containing protein [Planctomycetota bacterium]
MSEVPCPVCACTRGESIETIWHNTEQLAYVACAECGLIQLLPRPTSQELADYYADTFWPEHESSPQRQIQKQAHRAAHILRFTKGHLDRVRQRNPGGKVRILEIGSSYGRTLRELGDYVAAAGGDPLLFGIEPSRHAMEVGRAYYANIRVIGSSIDDIACHNTDPFDLIILSHVLEHLPAPVRSLERVAGSLARFGALYIEVPYYYGHPSTEYAHLFCFTEVSILNCLSRAGLRSTSVVVDGHDEPFPFYIKCLATKANGEMLPIRFESPQRIKMRRAAAMERFRAFRAARPRTWPANGDPAAFPRIPNAIH